MPREYGVGYLRKTSEVPKERLKSFFGRFNKEKQAALHNCLIIGIDFGTTFSGVSWVTVADFEQDNINIITQWPGTTKEQVKVPTQLYYEYGDKTPLWGYEVPNDVEALQWFKLLLLREDDMWKTLQESAQIGQAKRLLRESDKTAEDCVADYLRVLWKHTIKSILKVRPKYLIEALQFHVVLTVPAIWKDYARRAMEEAARKAGILDYRSAGPTSLTFAPEPEAAGLAALIERGRKPEPDNVFVICDAGGGTVDVITYRVADTQPLQLHEAVEGDGSVCGGIFIDEDFIVQCKNRIGRKWSTFSPADIKTILSEEWEYAIKPRYGEDESCNEYPVSIQQGSVSRAEFNDTSRKPYIRDGHIYFSSSDIQKAFDTRAVPGLLKLLESQLDRAYRKGLNVTGIILVGGLGSSPYIYRCLKTKYTNKGIEISQSTPERTRTAICRGAILKGLMDAPIFAFVPNAPSVLSTISRMSLGIKIRVPFKKGTHLREDRDWDEHEQRYFAQNQMDWYISKGEDVAKAHPIRKDYYRTYAEGDEFPEPSFSIRIYQNESDNPPTRFMDGVTEHSILHFDLSNLQYDDLKDYKGSNGRKVKRFDYTVQMVPSGASTEISIYFQGQKVGSDHVIIQID
ncbi:hypothetical protein CNMCM5623_001283 [Aspergillus felis]|uniref:Hsp70 family chaperone n=1 Tax=Aspergillus felis TaxID=1287682 RepID=A0A8H6Q8Y4_9EURO|nr:hypothetical protein CNMCM5623_001283 [Aspergillus felis]KAF7182852.1 hypothetical protein CNMCM7691_002596 [Aspergillus felis]